MKEKGYISLGNKYTLLVRYWAYWHFRNVLMWASGNKQQYQLSQSHFQMKSPAKKNARSAVSEGQPELRRSARQRKEPKNDDYFMGSSYLEDIFGQAHYDDDTSPKRGRKNYRYDDSDDYSQGHKYSKKNKQINSNKVEALLEWKFQLDILPITVNYLPHHTQEVLLDQFHTVNFTKNITTQNLSALGQDIQAIFINIEWGKKGQNMKDFHHLKIQSSKLMDKGLAFVWAPKQHVSQMLSIMEKKEFTYVQNLQIINFDIAKAKSLIRRGSNQEMSDMKQGLHQEQQIQKLIKSLEHVDPCDIIADEKSPFFNVSKRTLLMFKKNSDLKFELRHQRTCDVVFDMPLRLGYKCENDLKSYLYNMIQTLLPDCLTVNQVGKDQFEFKMMELWADKDHYRRGWISVVQE